MKNSAMDDIETSNRRARLRELISFCFNGNQENLLAFIETRTNKRPNQGELSAIQKNDGKSFGDKKAKALTEQIGLHRRWFDFPVGTNTNQYEWQNEPKPSGNQVQEQKPLRQPVNSNIKGFPTPLLGELNDVATGISDTGLRLVISYAKGIAAGFPKEGLKENAAN